MQTFTAINAKVSCVTFFLGVDTFGMPWLENITSLELSNDASTYNA